MGMQAVMTDELGQLRMQLQLEKDALERARTQRAADRSVQVSGIHPASSSQLFSAHWCN